MGIPLLKGRAVRRVRRQPRRARHARRSHNGESLLAGASPVDRPGAPRRRLRLRQSGSASSASWTTCVHIGLDHAPVPEMYPRTIRLRSRHSRSSVRTSAEPTAVAASVRSAVQRADSNLPIYDVRTMDERIAASFAQTRGTMEPAAGERGARRRPGQRSRSTDRSGTRSASRFPKSASVWRSAPAARRSAAWCIGRAAALSAIGTRARHRRGALAAHVGFTRCSSPRSASDPAASMRRSVAALLRADDRGGRLCRRGARCRVDPLSGASG